ncbi:hypothetical protein [Rheinheimera baltica]|uniref:hypothetical protein n=1 Tax=Rheinheimera baltica TaxID=67576 RepID=UPI00273FAB09|nr:hypothetical protein [Rheinheimera baltica]MDP5190448.1 hypothetical protein [Rheinheimera baltica]
MSVERFFVSAVQWLGWATIQVVLFVMAVLACVVLVDQIFEGEYSFSSLSVYEAIFMVLLIFVFNRSRSLHAVSGLGFGKYLYKLICNLAYLLAVILAFENFLENKADMFFNSVQGDLTFLGSFLIAIYASASTKPNNTLQNDTEKSDVSSATEAKVSSSDVAMEESSTEPKVESSNA